MASYYIGSCSLPFYFGFLQSVSLLHEHRNLSPLRLLSLWPNRCYMNQLMLLERKKDIHLVFAM